MPTVRRAMKRSAMRSAAIFAAAPATSRSSTRSSSRPPDCKAPTRPSKNQGLAAMAETTFRYIASAGRFVADLSFPGMLHVGLVASPYPFAKIRGIDAKAALALPGVHAVLTGAELAAGVDATMSGLDLPKVKRWPLAYQFARYPGEWVAAVVAESRAVAEDAGELVEVDYEPLAAVTDPESAMAPSSPAVHTDHGSNILFQKKWVWGPVEEDFRSADRTLSFRARWHRSSTVPIETFGVIAPWNPAQQLLDVWASVQMPN